MLLVLKIVLVLVLVALVVIVFGVWWFINKVKSAFKGALAGLTFAPPCRVKLQAESHPDWRNAAKIKEFTDDFAANGFAPIGAFSIPELRGMKIAAFVHEEQRLFGVVYDHEKLPPNFDVVCRYEDGVDLTVTNTTYASAMDRPPNSPAIRLEGIGVKEAVEAAWNHPANAPRVPVKAADFVPRFESSYAKEMSWRLSRGGVTREEVRRQAEKSGEKLTEEQLDDLHATQRTAYMQQLQLGCLAQFRQENKTADDAGPKAGENVFAVPEVLTDEEIRVEVQVHASLTDEQTTKLEAIKREPGQTTADFMARVLAEVAGPPMLERVGTVTEPLPAEIFRCQAAEDEAEQSDEAE